MFSRARGEEWSEEEGGMLCDFHNYDTMRPIADSRGRVDTRHYLGYHNRSLSVDNSYFVSNTNLYKMQMSILDFIKFKHAYEMNQLIIQNINV